MDFQSPGDGKSTRSSRGVVRQRLHVAKIGSRVVGQRLIRGTMRSMPDEPDKSGQEPNLELPPLLGFGRKKKRKQSTAEEKPVSAESGAEETIAVEPVGTDTAADSDPLAADPVGQAARWDRPGGRGGQAGPARATAADQERGSTDPGDHSSTR